MRVRWKCGGATISVERERRFRPTLDDCEEAIEYLEDPDNFDVADMHAAELLRAHVREYPEGSGDLFIILIWYGGEKPVPGEIPIPPGWRLDSDWFLAEIQRLAGAVRAWHVGLIFEGVDE